MGTFNDTIAADWEHLGTDWGTSVTYFPRTAEAVPSVGGVALLMVREEGAGEATADRSGAFLRQGEAVWSTSAQRYSAAFPGLPRPKLRDVFREADGTTWTVEDVDNQAGQSVHRMTARRNLSATG